MNMGYMISVIIGGMFLISAIVLKNSVFKSSHDTTFHLVTNTEVDNLRQIITHDMRFVGFGRDSEIVHFSDSSLHFRAVVDGELRDFSWSLGSTGPSASNPSLRYLERTGPAHDGTLNQQTHTFTVSHFHVVPFQDEHGTTVTSSADEVRSIWIELEVMAAESTGTNPDGSFQFATSRWNNLFRPHNLNL